MPSLMGAICAVNDNNTIHNSPGKRPLFNPSTISWNDGRFKRDVSCIALVHWP